tara:strand:- start:51513 stop:52241 length:729 start_codon:yes stop_codon:yes gene_type:complete
MKKTFTTGLVFLLLSTSCQANNTLHDELELIAKKSSHSYVNQYGTNLALQIFKRFKDVISLSNISIKRSEFDENLLTVNWLINKKRLTNNLQKEFEIYEGAQPDITSSTKTQSTTRRNKLYFHYAPLGIQNGLTFDLNSDSDKRDFLGEIFKDYKVFIEISYKEKKQYIPIVSSASYSGCGQSTLLNLKEILCIQTSPSLNNDPFIGYVDGYTNYIDFGETIEDINNVTVAVKYYYKGTEIK